MTKSRADELRRQQIRDAGLRCFVRQGYESTRLQDIACEAGFSKGGIYFYYREKRQIFLDILDAYIRTLHERWNFDATNEPADRTLTRVVIGHLRTIEGTSDETRLCRMVQVMASRDPALQGRLDEIVAVVRSLCTNVIVRGMCEGVFVSGDPHKLAALVHAILQGLECHVAIDGRLPVMAEEAAEHMLRLLRAPQSSAMPVTERARPRPANVDLSVSSA